MEYSWVPFSLLSLVAVGVVWLIGSSDRWRELRNLLLLGVLLRVVGSTLRLEVIDQAYGGFSDAKGYFNWGLIYSSNIADLDFGFIFSPPGPNERWWGTQFVRCVSGFGVLFTGSNIRAAFLLFSLFAFAGLVLCVAAFGRVFSQDDQLRYGRWVLLWPSLWFWPSSIGKEALMLFAIGLLVFGYVGGGTSRNWLVLGIGLTLAAAIRPHVAALLAVAVTFSEFFQPGSLLNARRITGAAVAALVGVYTVVSSLSQLGIEEIDIEGIQEEIEFRSDNTVKGGSAIAQVGGPLAVPMAFTNVLIRPFPWEARGLSIFSSLEVLTFWIVVLGRRRHWPSVLSKWRVNAFLRVGLPFALGLTFLYGITFANLGIIARQRVAVFPFLFTLLALTRLGAAERERDGISEVALRVS